MMAIRKSLLGQSKKLELVKVVNQRQINTLINQCWSALQQKHHPKQATSELLDDPDPLLQTFALSKFAEQDNFSAKDFACFEKLLKESAVEVRKMLIRAIMLRYSVYPAKAQQLLDQLSKDMDQEVKNAFVEYIPILIRSDWNLGFHYLKRFSENTDRYVRRDVVRKLHQLIGTSIERTMDRHREIFDLLLIAAQDKNQSGYVRKLRVHWPIS